MRRRLDALGLPLEVTWPAGARQALIFVSGDGGWAELDRQVADGLASRGIAVVGWNSLRYFWERKTPQAFGADLARVVEAIQESVRIFAGGYSFGAEVTPVAAAPDGPARPAALSRLAGLVLLAPGPYAAFEISPLDWFRSSEAPTRHPVRTALERWGGRPALCLEPADGGDSGCAAGFQGMLRERLPGGHHFAGDFKALSARIAEFIRETTVR
jgi:type IV secretory pathway VirJ component